MRTFAVVAAACLALLPAVAAEDDLVAARASAADRDVERGAEPHHEVLVDGAARAASRDGVPVAAKDGTLVLHTPAGPRTLWLGLPGTYGLATHPVLPDGTTVPAVAFQVEVDSDGRDAVEIAPERLLAEPSSATSRSSLPEGGDRWVSPTYGAGDGALPASAFRGRSVPTGAPGEVIEPRPAAPSEGPAGRSVRPSAIATTSAATAPTAVAVAGAALAILGLVALWPLYHRVQGARTLESATRRTIYDAVTARPGAGVAEAAEKAAVSYSTASYHLDRLVGEGMLVVSSDGGRLRYYKNGGFTEDDRKLLALRANKEAMRVLALIRENPGTYRAQVADALGVTTTTVNWHLKRLAAVGLVREVRAGRSAHLYAVEDRVAATAAAGERAAPPGDAASA